MIVLKSRREIDKMRAAGAIVAQILKIVSDSVAEGVSTEELDSIAEMETLKRNAKPAFKGYSGYPYSLCCSINEQVVHGMPSSRKLKGGDILSIDFGVLYEGFYGDAAVTLPVGKISAGAQKLIDVTRDSLLSAIKFAKPGRRLSDISHAVQSHAESNGFSVVRDFVGHGIGTSLHESPQIPNYGSPGKGLVLKPGMVLAIEPMINQKGFGVKVLEDGWTAITVDGGLSAHFEHTVVVCEGEPEILTKC